MQVECEAIAECLDEEDKDVVFLDDENESEDEEILLDESSDEEQSRSNDYVTTPNNSAGHLAFHNSTENLITHRNRHKSSSEWAMENLRLQQSSAAAAASATISNVTSASSSAKNPARNIYKDILGNVYENPEALENPVAHDYSRQGTSRMTDTRPRHDAMISEDSSVNKQQTTESNR